MSQPTKGKKQPPAKEAKAHVNKNASGTPGEKKGAEAAEKKHVNTSSTKPPTTLASGVSSISRAQPPVASQAKTMKPAESKATHKPKTEAEKALQGAKPDESQPTGPVEEKQRDPGGAKSKISLAEDTKQTSPRKEVSGLTARSTQLSTTEEAKAKNDNKPLASKITAGTAGAVTAAGLSVAETKENKVLSITPATTDSKPSQKSDLDAALDDLIDTLGSPEENEPPTPPYTGPEVLDPVSTLYVEELGKRESTIPPEYRKLLESKGDGKMDSPSVAVGEPQPTMTDDELADALSFDFSPSDVPTAGEKEVKPKEPGTKDDLLQAHSTTLVSSSAPPKEKKAKLEEVEISDDALDALVDTLPTPEPEPKEDVSPVVEIEEPKARERKEKKTGEHDDTIPPEYRLKPTLDKDGKPLLPKPEEKPKPINESELIDEFSKDFDSPTCFFETEKATPSTLADTPKKPKAAEHQTTTAEIVSAATTPSVKSSAPTAASPNVADEALEALSGSLGKREPAPEEKKPAMDKVKEKNKKEDREKLGEDEETIPPDYRLTETKDKDGKPLLPKPEEKPQPLSESELLDALSEDFSCSTTKASPAEASPKSTVVNKPAVVSTVEVISPASASAVHSSTPTQAVTPGKKELDDAADLLADSLGQREPDPDENKPVLDKIKEKAKSEHKDKLGEKDDTIPPDYRKILDSDKKGKPVKAKGKDAEKPKEQMKPDSESAAIDALSGDFDNASKPAVSQQSSAKEKSKGAASSKPTRREEKKSKASKKGKEQSSSGKSEKHKKS